MDQPIYEELENNVGIKPWLIADVIELEKEREALGKEKKKIEEARKQLEIENKALKRRVELEKRKAEREAKLFEMKWNLLETEVSNLSKEREEFNYKVRTFEESILNNPLGPNDIKDVGLMFRGVSNELELKKRYKDLMKIYHPDNVAGDSDVVKEISRQYEDLKEEYRVRY